MITENRSFTHSFFGLALGIYLVFHFSLVSTGGGYASSLLLPSILAVFYPYLTGNQRKFFYLVNVLLFFECVPQICGL